MAFDPEAFVEGTDAIATTFADPIDIERFQRAKARGASDEEAFAVGDNGVGKWGDDTTTDEPIAALPRDQAGADHNRMVEVTAGDRKVVARIADQMPSSANIRNGAGIDLNPAAAEAIGSTGKTPVSWRFVDNKFDPAAFVGETGETGNNNAFDPAAFVGEKPSPTVENTNSLTANTEKAVEAVLPAPETPKPKTVPVLEGLPVSSSSGTFDSHGLPVIGSLANLPASVQRDVLKDKAVVANQDPNKVIDGSLNVDQSGDPLIAAERRKVAGMAPLEEPSPAPPVAPLATLAEHERLLVSGQAKPEAVAKRADGFDPSKQDLGSSIVANALQGTVKAAGAIAEGATALSLADMPNGVNRGSAAEKYKFVKGSLPDFEKMADNLFPVNPQNKGAFLVQTAGEAGEFMPIIAAGPFAPFIMGTMAAGAELDRKYNDMVANGVNPEVAANRAFQSAVTSGLTEEVVWAVLPEPLRKLGDKFLIDKFGGAGVQRFIMNRVAQSGEGAALGASLRIAQNTATGQGTMDGVWDSTAGLAIRFGIMPRGAHDTKAKEKLPAAEPTGSALLPEGAVAPPPPEPIDTSVPPVGSDAPSPLGTAEPVTSAAPATPVTETKPVAGATEPVKGESTSPASASEPAAGVIPLNEGKTTDISAASGTEPASDATGGAVLGASDVKTAPDAGAKDVKGSVAGENAAAPASEPAGQAAPVAEAPVVLDNPDQPVKVTTSTGEPVKMKAQDALDHNQAEGDLLQKLRDCLAA